MKLYNINNEHLLTHRYGWYKIIETLIDRIDSDIILVDFMDKYFNLWFDKIKIIKCNNSIFYFYNKDVYYDIRDPEKNDVFIYYDKLNLYHIIKWFSESNEFKILDGEIINNFKKKYNINKIEKPWIGILHYPEFIKDMNFYSDESLPAILKSSTFKQSVKYCKGIITLSNHLKKYLIDNLNQYNYDIPIYVIYHPTDYDCKLFDLNDFIINKNPKLIQLGFWMRNMNTIYNINTDKYIKYWLPGGKYWKEMYKIIYDKDITSLSSDVIIKLNLCNEEYDNLLSNSICIVDVYNSSANNSVLECIARNTPLLINRHPAIIEYLTKDYPLYYNNIDELNNIINNENFIEKIIETNNFLKNLDKTQFTIDFFCNKVLELIQNIK